VDQGGYDVMLEGKLDVIAGVTLPQRLMMAAIPVLPKKMLLRQGRQMQEIPASTGRAVTGFVEMAA